MTQAMSEADFNNIRSIFQSWDTSGDGIITVSELRQSLSAAGHDFRLKEVQEIVKTADRDGDGRIDFEEFLGMMAKSCENSEKEAKEEVRIVSDKEASAKDYQRSMAAFKVFDKNDDGFIDLNELKAAMEDLQLEEDPEKISNLMKALDENGDSVIDYVEFGRLVHN